MKKPLICLIFLSLLLLNSCSSREGHSESSFKVSLGNLTSLDLSGGYFIKILSLDPLSSIGEQIIELNPDQSASIPFGTWQILMIGFAGPNYKSGDTYCGQIGSVTLDKSSTNLSIDLNQAACSSAPYPAFKSEILGNASWDIAQWDNATWGP